MKKSLSKVLSLILLLLFLLVSQLVSAQKQSPKSPKNLEGSWNVVIELSKGTPCTEFEFPFSKSTMTIKLEGSKLIGEIKDQANSAVLTGSYPAYPNDFELIYKVNTRHLKSNNSRELIIELGASFPRTANGSIYGEVRMLSTDKGNRKSWSCGQWTAKRTNNDSSGTKQ